MEGNKYLFEFVRDTPAKALTWHSAPYTGSVSFTVPKGTRAYLGKRMNPANYYFDPADGYYSQEWIESIRKRAKEESPIPHRFNGGLSPFIFIKTLLSDSVRFLAEESQNGLEPKSVDEILGLLREAYDQARRCALREESESFKQMLTQGLCSTSLNEAERNELLKDN